MNGYERRNATGPFPSEADWRETVRRSLGLRHDPALCFWDRDARELAEFMAVAEGPIPYRELAVDCFPCEPVKLERAIAELLRLRAIAWTVTGLAYLTETGREALSCGSVAG